MHFTRSRIAARRRVEALIGAPSPLVGEGREALPQMMMGEGGEPLGLNPSPYSACWTSGAALSRKGRGHINKRLQVVSGESHQHEASDDKHSGSDAGGKDRKPAMTAWPVGPRLALGPDHSRLELR
jgi:hypothetical protein